MSHHNLQSVDGTSIAYERVGSGPTVVLVGGGLTDRSENADVARGLVEVGCTVINYDRRSRGASGEGEPGLDLELADLGALAADVTGPVRLVGVSSGGALVLEFVASPVGSASVAGALVYEVPYLTDPYVQQAWADYVPAVTAALRDADLDRALELFMGLAGSGDAEIAAARASEHWPGLRDLAPTLAHDAAVLGDGRVPGRLAQTAVPVSVATGTAASAMSAFYASAADELTAVLPAGERVTLDNADHVLLASSAPAIARALGV